MEYALIVGGEFKEFRNYPEKPVDIPHKNVTWLPVVREQGPDFTGAENGAYVIRVSPPEERVPEAVTPRQARMALVAIGKLADVEAAVEAAGDVIKIAWEYSSMVLRNDPGVVALGKKLGMSDKDMDDLFKAASKI